MEETTKMIESRLNGMTSMEEMQANTKDLVTEPFFVKIDQLREAYGIKSFGSFQKNVALAKTTFYDVVEGRVKPQRLHVIKIGLAMGISLDDMNDLLKRSGHKELYVKMEDDRIIRQGILNKMSAAEIQEYLTAAGSSLNLLDKK